jgi:hypothetical protein
MSQYSTEVHSRTATYPGALVPAGFSQMIPCYPACRGVRPEQRLLGPDAGRLAEAGQAPDRVAAGQRPGLGGVPRVPEVIGADVHGRCPQGRPAGHRSTVSAGT